MTAFIYILIAAALIFCVIMQAFKLMKFVNQKQLEEYNRRKQYEEQMNKSSKQNDDEDDDD